VAVIAFFRTMGVSKRLTILVEGEKEQIERLANIVKKGPEHSQIRHVQIEERKWSGDFKDFKILRF